MGILKLRSQCSHSSEVPNEKLPVNSSCADLGCCPALRFAGFHARDNVSVYCKQLGFPGSPGLNREGLRAYFGAEASSRLPMSLYPTSFPEKT